MRKILGFVYEIWIGCLDDDECILVAETREKGDRGR